MISKLLKNAGFTLSFAKDKIGEIPNLKEFLRPKKVKIA